MSTFGTMRCVGLGVGLALVLTLPAVGQENRTAPSRPDSVRRPWYAPRYVVGQFAGGIGLGSVGLGYRWRRFETDILAGYVPRRYAGRSLGVFTLKAQHVPFTLPVTPRWQAQPLAVGALVSYTAGNLVRTRDDKYPRGYYWWSATVRPGLFVGSRIRRSLPAGRAAVLYYELGTNDLYLVNLLSNLRGGVPLGQVVTLGVGVKVDL